MYRPIWVEQYNCFLRISNLLNHWIHSRTSESLVGRGRAQESMPHCRTGAKCNQCNVLNDLPRPLSSINPLWLQPSSRRVVEIEVWCTSTTWALSDLPRPLSSINPLWLQPSSRHVEERAAWCSSATWA